jgi:hypothetical protein
VSLATVSLFRATYLNVVCLGIFRRRISSPLESSVVICKKASSVPSRAPSTKTNPKLRDGIWRANAIDFILKMMSASDSTHDARLDSVLCSLNALYSTVVCSICLETLSVPRRTKCGHTFCARCIHRVCAAAGGGRNAARCPMCNGEGVTKRSLEDDAAAGDMLGLIEALREAVERDARGIISTEGRAPPFNRSVLQGVPDEAKAATPCKTRKSLRKWDEKARSERGTLLDREPLCDTDAPTEPEPAEEAEPAEVSEPAKLPKPVKMPKQTRKRKKMVEEPEPVKKTEQTEKSLRRPQSTRRPETVKKPDPASRSETSKATTESRAAQDKTIVKKLSADKCVGESGKQRFLFNLKGKVTGKASFAKKKHTAARRVSRTPFVLLGALSRDSVALAASLTTTVDTVSPYPSLAQVLAKKNRTSDESHDGSSRRTSVDLDAVLYSDMSVQTTQRFLAEDASSEKKGDENHEKDLDNEVVSAEKEKKEECGVLDEESAPPAAKSQYIEGPENVGRAEEEEEVVEEDISAAKKRGKKRRYSKEDLLNAVLKKDKKESLSVTVLTKSNSKTGGRTSPLDSLTPKERRAADDLTIQGRDSPIFKNFAFGAVFTYTLSCTICRKSDGYTIFCTTQNGTVQFCVRIIVPGETDLFSLWKHYLI